MKAIFLIVLFLVGYSFMGVAQDSRPTSKPQGFGAVQGRVVDAEARPIVSAKVYVEPIDQPTWGKVRYAVTAANGEFSLADVPAGQDMIFAVKQDDFYPDTRLSVLAEDPGKLTRVLITKDAITRDVTVRLGPKGGKLQGRIVDNETGDPIVNSRIRIVRPENPRLFVSTGPDEQGNFEFVLPSVPLRIEVSAPNYKTWFHHAGALPLVKSEEVRTLVVHLQRIKAAE
jgi:Carboxypeptidase regulatory-like domain